MDSKKLLALDVGLARIGVATCDPLGLAAHPLLIIERQSRRDDFAKLAQMVAAQEVVAVLCGLPLNIDGSEGPRVKSIRKWAMRLAHALRVLCTQPIPIIFWDERLTTFAANEIMAEMGITGHDDGVAAAVILQNYLDAQRAGDTTNLGLIDLPPKEANDITI